MLVHSLTMAVHSAETSHTYVVSATSMLTCVDSYHLHCVHVNKLYTVQVTELSVHTDSNNYPSNWPWLETSN